MTLVFDRSGEMVYKANNNHDAGVYAGCSTKDVYDAIETGDEVNGFCFDYGRATKHPRSKPIIVVLPNGKRGRVYGVSTACKIAKCSKSTFERHVRSGTPTERGVRFERL